MSPVLAAAQAIVVPQVDFSGHFYSPVPQANNITISAVLTYRNRKFSPATAVVMLTGELKLEPLLLVKKLAATGYCFGGLYATRLIQNNTIAVGTMAHPSSLNVPTDFELVKAQSHAAIEINNAELDTGFTPALALETDAVLGDGQYLPGYFRRQFDGVGHGFAVRANASDPVQIAAKQGAFDTSLAFIKMHLN
ncbi:hypothetical protein FB451DRAFT_1186077 [Mycena latifolia]|nr:hypothetical protein FB451DRAFT_1186077 [Mycena latifolia]